MIISINQPAYLPWAGYFDRIIKSDKHIILDHVQFEKNSLTNRNKIKTAQGESLLSVPVKTKGKFKDCAIRDLETNDTLDWRRKHFQSIKGSYSKADFFVEHSDFFESVYAEKWPLLYPFIEKINGYLFEELGVKTPMVLSSTLDPQATKSDLVLELCQKMGATQYLSGPFGRDYLDKESFDAVGIEILFHSYTPPVYPQLYGDFIGGLSVIDMLFNCGAKSGEILQNSMDSIKRA